MRILGILLASVFCSLSACAQTGPSLWGSKRVTVSDLQKRVGFRVMIPQKLPAGWQFDRAEVAWIPVSPVKPTIPARRAICLFFAGEKDSITAVIQARAVPGIPPAESLDIVVREGYFFRDSRVGSWRSFERAGHTDFAVVSIGVGQNEIKALIHEIKRLHGAGSRNRTSNPDSPLAAEMRKRLIKQADQIRDLRTENKMLRGELADQRAALSQYEDAREELSRINAQLLKEAERLTERERALNNR